MAKAPRPTAKCFKASKWDGKNDGEKIILYAESGMGKTTLASLAPKPVFIGIDDGGRKIKNPLTGEDLDYIEGVVSFADVRDALHQSNLFDPFSTVVIDNVTELENLAVQHVVKTVAKDKGEKAKNLVDFGWGKGYTHLYDHMKMILQDCDTLVRQGKNVILIAQSAAHKVANAGGEDFLCDGPRLYDGQKDNVEALYREWSDHVLRIALGLVSVKDGRAYSDQQRVIFTQGEVHFRAKSRTLPPSIQAVTFNAPSDDTIWKYIWREG